MEEIIGALEAQNTWLIVPFHARKWKIACKWVYRIKYQ